MYILCIMIYYIITANEKGEYLEKKKKTLPKQANLEIADAEYARLFFAKENAVEIIRIVNNKFKE